MKSDVSPLDIILAAGAAALVGGVAFLATRPRTASMFALKAEGPGCFEVQDFIFEYLMPGNVDPFDFNYMVEEWMLSAGHDPHRAETTYVEDLDEEELEAFKAWLITEGMEKQRRRAVDTEDPAYMLLSSESKVPAGTWLAHFTEGDFDWFDRGTNLRGLHLSRFKSEKDKANCEQNLSFDDIGPYDTVYAFSFDAAVAARNQATYQKKYGHNILLFQSDCAVSAYHSGDDEHQVIFPACSEYNVFQFRSLGGRDLELVGSKGEDGEPLMFSSLKEAYEYVKQKEVADG